MDMDEMLRRAQAYVGLPYLDGEFDCADLAVKVQWELWGRLVTLPLHRRRPQGARGQAAQIRALRDELADRIETPVTGCGVLLLTADDEGAELWHIGTVFESAGETWVLHNSHVLGSAHLHRLADMRRRGMRVEGFYQWREAL